MTRTIVHHGTGLPDALRSANRQPNDMVYPIPPGCPAVPAGVQEASDALVSARERFYELVERHRDADEELQAAQAADAAAVREAYDADKEPPKPKARPAVEAAQQVELLLEPARAVAIEAEDRYLNAVRTHHDEWLGALGQAREASEARLHRALDEASRAKLDSTTIDLIKHELEHIGDDTFRDERHRTKANQQAMFRLGLAAQLDEQDERRLVDFREGRDSITPQTTRSVAW